MNDYNDLVNYNYDPNMDFEARIKAAREASLMNLNSQDYDPAASQGYDPGFEARIEAARKASLMKLDSQDYEGRAWDQGQGIHNLGQVVQPASATDPVMEQELKYQQGFNPNPSAAPFTPQPQQQPQTRYPSPSTMSPVGDFYPNTGVWGTQPPMQQRSSMGETSGPLAGPLDKDAFYNREADQFARQTGVGGQVKATINGKEYDYTSQATNPYVQGITGETGRAPQLTGNSHTFQEYVGQGKYGEEMYQPHTVQTNARDNKEVDAQGPAASFMQGTPEQQRALEFERLQEENLLGEERFKAQYNALSPQERAEMISQQKAAADPRFQMVQQFNQILENVVLPQVREQVAAFRQANPNATPQMIADFNKVASQNIVNAASQMFGSIFGNRGQLPFEFGDYTPVQQQAE